MREMSGMPTAGVEIVGTPTFGAPRLEASVAPIIDVADGAAAAPRGGVVVTIGC